MPSHRVFPPWRRAFGAWRFAGLLVMGTNAATHTALAAAAPPHDHGFAAPAPSLIEHLRAQHRRGDWLFVTTTNGERMVRVSAIGPDGLSGASDRRGITERGELIAWGEIVAIERRRSHRPLGVLMGAITGAGLATALPRDDFGEGLSLAFLGGFTGGWIGGAAAGRRDATTPLYAGVPRAGGGDPTAVPHYLRTRLEVGQSLRVRSGPLVTVGELAAIESRALRMRSGSLLRWQDISRIDRRRSNAGRGAALGAAFGGIALGAIGAAASSDPYFGGSSSVAGLGVLLGAASGAVLGGVVGAFSQGHVIVYARPATIAAPADSAVIVPAR